LRSARGAHLPWKGARPREERESREGCNRSRGRKSSEMRAHTHRHILLRSSSSRDSNGPFYSSTGAESVQRVKRIELTEIPLFLGECGGALGYICRFAGCSCCGRKAFRAAPRGTIKKSCTLIPQK
jgi:hypothetical protein